MPGTLNDLVSAALPVQVRYQITWQTVNYLIIYKVLPTAFPPAKHHLGLRPRKHKYLFLFAQTTSKRSFIR